MAYIDGFVLAVPTSNKGAYKAICDRAGPIFKEHGALSMVECWGDDIPPGQHTSFPMAVKLKDDETVVFSWIIWPSKAVRDQGMQKVMEDTRMKTNDMPFDGQRMIFGGFDVLYDSEKS